MANEKKKDKLQATAEEPQVDAPVANSDEQDLEALKLKLKKEAMAEVLDALGMEKSDLDEAKRIKAQNAKMVDYDIGNIDVTINGVNIPSKGRVTAAEAEQITGLAANKRHRHMTEIFGKKGIANLELGVVKAEIAVTETIDLAGKVVG